MINFGRRLINMSNNLQDYCYLINEEEYQLNNFEFMIKDDDVHIETLIENLKSQNE